MKKKGKDYRTIILTFIFCQFLGLALSQFEKESTKYIDSLFVSNEVNLNPSPFVYDSIKNTGFVDGFRHVGKSVEIDLFFIKEDGKLIQLSQISKRKRKKLICDYIDKHKLNDKEEKLLQARISKVLLVIDNRFNTNFSDFNILIRFYEFDKVLD